MNKKNLVSFALAATLIGGATVYASAQDKTGDEYIVKKGDTLGSISKMYYGNVNYYDEIALYNDISNPDLIYPGQKLYIPSLNVIKEIVIPTTTPIPTPTATIEPTAAPTPVVTPQSTSVPTPTATLEPIINEYVVHDIVKGDTLSEICEYYYHDSSRDTVWKVATYNNLYSPNKIYAGNKLVLPPVYELNAIIPCDYTAVINEEISQTLKRRPCPFKFY